MTYLRFGDIARPARPSRTPGEWLRLLVELDVARAIEGGELWSGWFR